ncbi:S9 family peptidase [Novosphingobium sp. Fuku2-ISO-50]|uniref:alpha/beta hydrolase family protein n=1 Tax=Novosphingobium sp. Fuku2-ISO-50 TaxID=1739114 RepID=UPI00076BFA19|nr:alpha/beta hydrolase [Novosphingobium sp. Fuku2-ISO-50]KUR81315.1 hypothetical protein AQZ50_01850 [Novosphingobium sp. Fuku2-ISO-50]
MRAMLPAVLVLAAAFSGGSVAAQGLPAALSVDPPRDGAHPARLVQIRYPTGGLAVPARLFVAAGAGAHPTVLLLHGFPGTELNLDLARVLQRDGWNVLAIHYRGVWGGPGDFSLGHVVEDAHAALAWLRSPAAGAYGIDQKRIVVLGHSMGGFATTMLGDDPLVAGYVLISAADMVQATLRSANDPAARAEFADDASYTNASLESLQAEARAHLADWQWAKRAALLAPRPVLVITSDDGLAPGGEAVAAAAATAGSPKPQVIHMTTDHSFNDHRVALCAAVVNWLDANFPQH